MKKTLNQSERQLRLYYYWVLLPVLAYWLSLMTGWGAVVFFPVLVTIAHYLILRQFTAVVRPSIWFVTMPITLVVWIRWGPMHYLNVPEPNGILYGVVAYYAGQLVNALLIPPMTQNWSPSTAFMGTQVGTDLTIRWVLAMLLAAALWIGLYALFVTLTSGLLVAQWRAAGDLALLIVYPTIGLIAGGLSGLVLTRGKPI